MKHFVLKLLYYYKNLISPFLGNLFGGSCRFTPTCSEYSYEAIEKYGLIKGIIKSCQRISKCHPFGDFGYDPVTKSTK